MDLKWFIGLQVPQTLGEEMNVENEEDSYEQTLENTFGLFSMFFPIK